MSTANSKGPIIGIRHLQAALLFVGIVVNYVSRLNVSVAVVAMTNATTANPNFPEYNWTEQQRSYILSSFYWGYIVTQFPGGFFCRRFGTKLTLFVPTFATAVLSALTPYSISWGGWQAFSVLRVLQGLFQGVIFPCVHQHLANWSPPDERNRLGVFAYSGADCGVVLALAISGLIAEGPMGWPGISYVSAAMCIFWCILWLIFGANNASASPFISSAESQYIESSMSHAKGFHEKKIPIPWRAIWTSAPFYAVLVARCAQDWGDPLMQQQTPSYINGVLKLEIAANALYSALPFLAMWCCSYIFLIAADMITMHQWMSLTAMRKMMNTIAFWGPAAALIGIGFLSEDQKIWAIVLLTISSGLNAGSGIGSLLNIIDMSPNHAGMLMSIANGIASFFPLLTPLMVGVIVTDTSNRSQWQIVFALTALVFFLGNVVYLIWGRTETQAWDAEDYLLKKRSDFEQQSVSGAKRVSSNAQNDNKEL